LSRSIDLSEDGFRVLAIANKKVGAQTAYSKADEENLVLTGYLAFLDPPKDTAKTAIAALRQHGVTVKVLTGDNDLVTRKVCTEVGINAEKILLGNDVEKMSDEQLAGVIDDTDVYRPAFARAQKARRAGPAEKRPRRRFHGRRHQRRARAARRRRGHFGGHAVDIAKESADMILLEKSLMVLEEGVLEGRKVFANILKYIRMGASSNFGNMFSVLGASAWFPFPADAAAADPDQQPALRFFAGADPHRQRRRAIHRQAAPVEHRRNRQVHLFIGPISSIFDYSTFFVMWFYLQMQSGLGPPPDLAARFGPTTADPDHTYAAALFNTGWFVESIMTQTLIIHVIRTTRFRSFNRVQAGN
jgi:Mg2+-importing ATPase